MGRDGPPNKSPVGTPACHFPSEARAGESPNFSAQRWELALDDVAHRREGAGFYALGRVDGDRGFLQIKAANVFRGRRQRSGRQDEQQYIGIFYGNGNVVCNLDGAVQTKARNLRVTTSFMERQRD